MKVTNKEKQIIREYLKKTGKTKQGFCKVICGSHNPFHKEKQLGSRVIKEAVNVDVNNFNTCVYFLYYLLSVTNKEEAERFKKIMIRRNTSCEMITELFANNYNKFIYDKTIEIE